jgi:hypothetical protein
MKRVANKLRQFAEQLRKQGAEQTAPAPVPNPVASRARGDLGSMAEGLTSTGKENFEFAPKLPKIDTGGK